MKFGLKSELQSGIEHVAHRVAQQIGGQHDQQYRKTRDGGDMRRDEQEAGRERLRALMAEGLASGPGPGWATQREQLRQRARGTTGGQA